MRELSGSVSSLGATAVKKGFWNCTENTVPWKELVHTAAAPRNQPRNSAGPASSTHRAVGTTLRRMPQSCTTGSPVRSDSART